MSSATTSDRVDLDQSTSLADQLRQKHTVTIEDAEDPDLPVPTLKQKSEYGQSKSLDTKSHELFPELGGPKKANSGVAPIWNAKGSTDGNNVHGGSYANGGSEASKGGPPSLSIPGRNVAHVLLEPQQVMPRSQLKRPIPDILKDLNRKSRANVSMVTAPNGRLRFEATGPSDVANQALRDLVQQIGAKQTVTVSVPQSVRPHIIGKQGAAIKALQERTGARIQLPKDNNAQPVDDDDEAMVDVVIEGNAVSARAAQDAILNIAKERSANVTTKLRNIPAEFYPFLSRALQLGDDVIVRIPPHQPFTTQPPPPTTIGQRPTFSPAPLENLIQVAGDRAAVQSARAEIERIAEQLHQQLELEQASIQRGRHQFIIGERGLPAEEFFNETGCTIVMPVDGEDDVVTIIGPPNKVQNGMERAMDLAMNMQMSNLDISRFHRQAPGGASAHARNVTRYLRQRQEIQRLEEQHNTHINTPYTQDGALPWELYARDGKNAIRAQSEIKGLVDSHPPSRMATVPVDPFFHTYLKKEINKNLKERYGVNMVVPETSEAGAPVLLVFEEVAPVDAPYQVPRNAPSQADIRQFQEGLRAAEKHLLDIIRQQEEILTHPIEVPQKFHEKLKRFIKAEQQKRPEDQIPLRVSSIGQTVILRGPKTPVEKLAAKINAWVAQETEDEKERGFTLDFDFPQKFANHLIGKGGSNIRELKERFDVDIQVDNGKVEVKGPKAKAEAAKSHILSLGRQLADETTHTLKIDPKFHRELIGAQGAQINRLQTRYKVLIFFPRSAKPAKDDDSAGDAGSEAGAKPRRQQAPDEVIIRGPKKGADEARDEILSLVQYLKDNSFTATITVQQKQLPHFIGSGGSNMDALRQQTGAKIDIPNGRDTPDSTVEILIKGTKSQVAAAKKILEEKKSVFDDTVVREVEVDRKFHKSLIGPGGSTLRDIVVAAGGSDDRRELARTVRFPKQDSEGNTIKIEGRTEVVEKILAKIQEIVSQRESQVSDVIDVPVEKHRTLIGRGGDVKRQMENKFKVSIDIPKQGDGKTDVKISGQPSDVNAAKEHILSLIKEQQGETVEVPRNLHHAVSGGGQFFRKLRNDLHVTVDHAGHQVPPRPSQQTRSNGGGALPLITDEPDANAHSWHVMEANTSGSGEDGIIPWVFRGSEENVEKAKKLLETALAQAKKPSATGYLTLSDPRTYRFVIGQGGSKVNQIRKQSGCTITVPKQGSDDPIEVVGTKEGVEKAKDLILAAVEEGSRGPAGRD
ncbi:hypothetical protein PspLS_00604 [Pyricularia sp. CBS 133598]|nr:hypothetical protein PspLS_00604 [Pyricularia sp. CBS 133598]